MHINTDRAMTIPEGSLQIVQPSSSYIRHKGLELHYSTFWYRESYSKSSHTLFMASVYVYFRLGNECAVQIINKVNIVKIAFTLKFIMQ